MKVTYLTNIVPIMHVGRQDAKFPGSFFAPPQTLIDEALSISFDGVQFLPTRGSTGEERGILLYEDAWNAIDSFWGGFRHHTGSEGMPACLNDWVVSPDQAECAAVSAKLAERGIPKVVHHFGKPGEILEIHAGLDMPIEEIKQKCLDLGMAVCIDTLHFNEYLTGRIQAGDYFPGYWGRMSVLYTPQDDQPQNRVRTDIVGSVNQRIDARDESIEELGNLIKIIHVHPEDQPGSLSNGTGRSSNAFMVTKNILKRKMPDDEIVLVAEYNPGKFNLLWPHKIRAKA